MSDRRSKRRIDRLDLGVAIASAASLVVGSALAYLPAGLIAAGLLGLAAVALSRLLAVRRMR